MKAVEITRAGHAELVERDDPRAREGEVLVRVHASGVCASDIAAYLGKHPYRVPPVITGHEAAGIVKSIGEDVETLSIGDSVILEPHIGCGHCHYCRSGEYNLCKGKRVLGTGNWPGSFAEYVVVPEACAYKVPRDIPLAAVSLIEPLCVGLHAVEQAPIEPGSTVAILGSGAIGLTLLLAVLQKKPGTVICSDIRPGNLDMARELGATRTVNVGHQNIQEEVKAATHGRGVDISFVAVASDQAMAQALEVTRLKGTIVLIALFEGPSRIDLREIQLRERKLVGTLMYTREDYLRAVQLLPSLRQSLERLITHRIAIEDLPAMLESLSRGEVSGSIKVVVDMH
jgi:L-iditol 2-dehydrogenase